MSDEVQRETHAVVRHRGKVVVALWHMARPPIWTVSLVPLWVGHLLATKTMFPPLDHAWPLGVAATVFGPLVWAAALSINDVHDLVGDRENPRKQRSPLVTGALSPLVARRISYWFALAALCAAVAVSIGFTLMTAVFLALAWAYSAPPLRLKSRAGADVVVNAIGIGVLPALAGWSVTRPLASFPSVMLVEGALVAVALYVPTTLVDYDADVVVAYDTLATRMGYRESYRVGFGAWSLANACAVVLSVYDIVIPREMLPVLVVTAPALMVAYHALIGRAVGAASLVRGIVATSCLFLVPNVVFGLVYTGSAR